MASTVAVTDVEVVAATCATSGTADLSPIASASARVKVEAEPNPPRVPSLDVVDPGATISRFEPSELIGSSTSSCAPWPRPTVRITEAMPITIPSMVSTERSRLARTASKAVRKVSAQFIGRPPPRHR